MEQISKSEAARRWQVSPAAVTKYVRSGMPVRNDGKLDWEIVKQWHRDNVLSHRSGSYRSRVLDKATAGAAAQPDEHSIGRRSVRSAIRECGPTVMVLGDKQSGSQARIRALMEIDAYLDRWSELNDEEPLADLRAFDWQGFSPEIQKLAKVTQAAVAAEFAEMRKRDVSTRKART
jgi:hypothetical protein